MSHSFQQTDDNILQPTSVCTALSNAGAVLFPIECSNGGTAGSAAESINHNTTTGGASRRFEIFKCVVGAGVSWDAGTWTTRINITTANMNITATAVYICRVDSSGNNQATIGSATGLSISFGSTGVKSQDVTGSGQTPSVGDVVWVVYELTNGAMSAQAFSHTPTQLIDSPFTLSVDSPANRNIYNVSQAVNRASTY